MSIHQPKIFISYARADREFALKLGKELRAASADIWLDSLDISTGERWDDAIEEALTICESFLIVLSPASIGSDNVKDELSLALEEKKQIIPVLYQNCQIPFRIRRIQYSDFTREYNTGLEQLLNALDIKQSQKKPEKTDFKEHTEESVQKPLKDIENQQELENYSEPLKRKNISFKKKLVFTGLVFVLMLSAGLFWMNTDITPLTSQEEKLAKLEPKAPLPKEGTISIDKRFDFSKLNSYKIGIYLHIKRDDLSKIAEDIKFQLIKNGFSGIIEINKRDDIYFEKRAFAPKSFEIRYDQIPIEDEVSKDLESILKSIYPNRTFRRQAVKNTRNNEVVISKNFISIFLGP